MNESVLELIHSVFNTFLFIMSVAFSLSLLGLAAKRSASAERFNDTRAVYTRQAAEESMYVIRGSSVIDTVHAACQPVGKQLEVVVDNNPVSEELMSSLCKAGSVKEAAIREFYKLIEADKEYEINYEYDDNKVCVKIILDCLEE